MNRNWSAASALIRTLTLGISDLPWVRRVLRRALSLGIRGILRARSRPLDLKSLGTVLVVAPHPDDETFGCGGTLALLARAGGVVRVAFVTNGSGSHPNHPTAAPADIARLRIAEARAASEILGLDWKGTQFLGATDGMLSHLDPAAGRALDEAIAETLCQANPSTVLTPCRRDGSSEHDAAFVRTRRVLSLARPQVRLFEFPVWSWWNPRLGLGAALRCPRIWRTDTHGVRSLKQRAIECYCSQILPLPPQEKAALPLGFTSFFLGANEYFFEW